MVKESQYLLAKEKFEESDYDGAEQILRSLDGYRDSDFLIRDVQNSRIYAEAESELDRGNFDIAIELFLSLKDFEDSELRIEEATEAKTASIYAEAEKLFDSGDYFKAAEVFSQVGDDKDSLTRSEEADEAGMAEKTVDYRGFIAAPLDSSVTIVTYVQAKQSWWDNKATVYAQDKDGAYFLYNLECSEEDYDKLVPGQKLRITGYKAEWCGEIEIVDATFELLDGDSFIAEPIDVTDLLGKDELIVHQNQLVSLKGMTVEAYDNTGAAFVYKNEAAKTDDLYFKVSKNGQAWDFCVEYYLCNEETEVYKAVESLKVGDKIDLEGFLYWYEGPNPHITSVTICDVNDTYDSAVSAGAVPTNFVGTSLGSGTFRSDSGTPLNIHADWSAVISGPSTVDVTVTTYVDSLSLYTTAMPDTLRISFDGQYVSLGSPAIEIPKTTELVSTKINSHTVTVNLSRGETRNIPIEVIWTYHGTYDGMYIDSIQCNGNIILTASPAVPEKNGAPRVTKSPSDETVQAGGSASFVSRYQNAKWAEWHFVSPDGTQDIDYTVAENQFPQLRIFNGFANNMTLENIPEALNGWMVYCRYSNDFGSVNTDRAIITVIGGSATDTAAALPKVTKSPSDETVQAGGSAWFIAKYQDAIWAVWHFVSPDGNRDLAYTDAAAVFQGLKIIGGDQSTMQMQNIPTDLNGWKVYCSFRNNVGSVNTDAAMITVSGAPAAQNTDAAQTQPAGTVIVPQNTSSGYTGTYVEGTTGRGTMEITGSPSLYNVHVRWADGASAYTEWTFSGTFGDTGILSYNDAIMTHYDMSNNTSKIIFRNGSGTLAYIDRGLHGVYWTEFRSDASADNTFFQKQ